MSRHTEARGKLVRRFGANIYGNPKYDRLLSRRPNGPGVQGASKTRKKVSEYGQQLIEKQKIRFTYGLSERQFRNLFRKALRGEGVTSDSLMVLLEQRLDNVVYRAGMAPTRPAARQFVLHGHLKVNGRRVNVPSFAVSPGDVVTVKSNSKSQALVSRNIEEAQSRGKPEWLKVQPDQLRADVERLPLAKEVELGADVQKVVELYSK